MSHIRRIEQISFERGESWTDCKTVVKLWVSSQEAGQRWVTHYFTVSLALAETMGRAIMEAAQNGMACEKATEDDT